MRVSGDISCMFVDLVLKTTMLYSLFSPWPMAVLPRPAITGGGTGGAITGGAFG